MARKSLFPKSRSNTQFSRPEGAANFDNQDDFNFVGSINSQQGTIQHTPTQDKDIVNKEYVDGAIIKQRLVFAFGSNANTTTLAGGAKNFRSINGVQLKNNKGYFMAKSGSIVFKSLTWDVTAKTGSVDPSLEIMKNGSSLWKSDIDATVANNKHEDFTAAEGTYTFSAGDHLYPRIVNNEIFGSGNDLSWNEGVGHFEVIYD